MADTGGASNVPWRPSTFVQFEKVLASSMRTAIISTDAGRAYLKAMGNPEGPHALACEWVGTQLARWFGLPTFDFAIFDLGDDDEIPLKEPYDGKARAAPGPAFVTRAVSGQPWGGTEEEMDRLENPDDLSRLVVFDTWTLNCDRCPPPPEAAGAATAATTGVLAAANPLSLRRKPHYDNVFFCGEGAAPGGFRLIAMDHTHCFTCGRPLTDSAASIDRVREERVYGLFPQFVRRISKPVVETAANRLRDMNKDVIAPMVATIPPAWDVSDKARSALEELVCRRAAFLADKMMDLLAPRCWPQEEIDFGNERKGGEP